MMRIVLLVFASVASGSDIGLNVVQIIENYKYPFESHTFGTEDGYLLTYHRIPACCQKPVVIIMHGILSSSADYVCMGPKRSLGFILSDAGYDVWLANARGNFWSRNHTTLSPDRNPEKFYDFSWHEIGYYDLPAAIDYILGITKQDQLYYVGHSQGGTALTIMGSTRPKYNSKIKLASLLAPATFRVYENNLLFRILTLFINDIERLVTRLGFYEIPFTKDIHTFLSLNCQKSDPIFRILCRSIYIFFGGVENNQLDADKLPVMFSNTPSNTAIKQFYHYAQLIRSGTFAQYDYGSKTNRRIYGTFRPPSYNLSKVTAPLAIYYGAQDHLVNVKDVDILARALANVKVKYLVPYKLFGHLDFVYGKDVVKLMYTKLLNDMRKYQK